MSRRQKAWRKENFNCLYAYAKSVGDKQEEFEWHVYEHKFALIGSTKSCGIHVIVLLKSMVINLLQIKWTKEAKKWCSVSNVLINSEALKVWSKQCWITTPSRYNTRSKYRIKHMQNDASISKSILQFPNR